MASAQPSADKMGHNNALLEVYSHIEYPFTLTRGEGVYVWDSEGQKYIDFYGGHCVCSLGHSPEVVVSAIHEQSKQLLFYSNLAPLAVKVRGAERLISFASNAFTKAFFCNSGAEANENALKIAVKKTGRPKLVAFKGGFHGRTLLAMTATHNQKWHEQYHHWVGSCVHLTPNALEEIVAVDEETAAVILEPIQSIGGCTEFAADFLAALRRRCDEVGAMLIFDEVQTGIGRTGSPFVSGHFGAQPDMMTLAKGLAGGFPIGAVAMTDAVAQTIAPGDIAATFGAGPLAMAAMIATLDEIEQRGLARHAVAMEQSIRAKLTLPEVTRVAGRGLLLGVELDREAKPVQQQLFKNGIIVGTNANPKMIHLLPPLTIGEAEVDALREGLIEVLR
ncbi:MAG: aminotransferase class III-fold pyridoxal phosphate-dependent enzyme [Bdellovibrionales bacterium]|nr:aminotransferase class III-fold pyridoxal phosphate-dependent enzyme [Bdellovibrionales bacterium]